MWKTLLLVAGGLAAGFAVALWMQPDAPTGAAADAAPGAGEPQASTARTDRDTRGRLEQLERALQAETEERAALEQRVFDLGAELDALRTPRQMRPARRPGSIRRAGRRLCRRFAGSARAGTRPSGSSSGWSRPASRPTARPGSRSAARS